jgi:hypothetical protein
VHGAPQALGAVADKIQGIAVNELKSEALMENFLAEFLWESAMSHTTRKIATVSRLMLLALVLPLAACSKSDNLSVTDSAVAKPSLAVFASPEQAGTGLLDAAKSGDQNALLGIFGPQSKELILSGDAVQDKATINTFVAAYGVMHRWRKMPDDGEVLLVGADNFPFPIPLQRNAQGQWFFDTAAGKQEILSRRIGRNELAVIDVCRAAAQAQAEYFSQLHDGGDTRQYAVKFISDAGRQNGLYWPSPEGQPKSPLGPLVAFATTEGYSAEPDQHTPFHGYYFHMLNRQGSHVPGGAKEYVVNGNMVGGFALVAYPAQYGNSGVMTFIINQDGVLLQKDLGKTTTETAAAMTEFDPDGDWSQVPE